MPGPWYAGGRHDPDYYEQLAGEFKKGVIVEARVFDVEKHAQGTVIVGVVESGGPAASLGRFFKGVFITASDPYYVWWAEEGAGRDHADGGTYHFCRGDPCVCKAMRPSDGHAAVVHFDSCRFLQIGDLTASNLWACGAEHSRRVQRYLSQLEDSSRPQVRARSAAAAARAADAGVRFKKSVTESLFQETRKFI